MKKYEVNRRYQFDGDTSPVDGEAMITVWFESGSTISATAKQFVWFEDITHIMVLEYPPEKYVRWVNMYGDVSSDFYKTREEADLRATKSCTACIKVEYMDGEGL
jgi:hypothetical protein